MRLLNRSVLTAALVGAIATTAFADVPVRVTVDNLAPTNSIAFAPLRVGFNAGVYDSFNEGEMASDAIVSIAEGGSGDAWFPAFEAADPTATLGSVVPDPAGPLLPGGSAMADFTVDESINPYFTFGAMVVPSNDYFIGNDSPTEYELLAPDGSLNFDTITLTASDIWDAGSEVDGTFGAAFLDGQMNDDRIPDDENVHHDFADLSIFNGETTAAGYTFDSQLSADTEVYRISFSIIPEPGAALLMAVGGLAAVRRRR